MLKMMPYAEPEGQRWYSRVSCRIRLMLGLRFAWYRMKAVGPASEAGVSLRFYHRYTSDQECEVCVLRAELSSRTSP